MSISPVNQLILLAIHLMPVIPIIGLARAKRHRWIWWVGVVVTVSMLVGLYGSFYYAILSTIGVS